MSLFNRNKFKKFEPQNVSFTQESNVTPKIIEPKMPTPMAIAEISKAVIQNMSNEQPADLSIMNKELDTKISKKIEELEFEIKVKQEALNILRGI